ncbi:MAG: uncharacterized protein QOH03_1820 [Kribbellaceae bacterium]|nr:uncharacterized protein [Kribbellaceae bacterium]
MNLLRSHQVGRVVYSDGAIPVATPVNYIFDGGAVVFRTHPGSRLAKATRDTVLSFQVDEVDVDTASGWSVIVTGVGQVLGGLDLLQAEHGPLVSWAGDDRTHLVRIPASLVSGCRVGSRLGGERPALSGVVGSQVESLVTPPG